MSFVEGHHELELCVEHYICMVIVLKGLVTPLMLQHALSCFLHIDLKFLSKEVLLVEGICLYFLHVQHGSLCVTVIQTAKFHALSYSFHSFIHSFIHSWSF